MNKVLNYMFFLGTLARSASVFLKDSVPSWKRLVQANKNDKFIEELEKASINPIAEKNETSNG